MPAQASDDTDHMLPGPLDTDHQLPKGDDPSAVSVVSASTAQVTSASSAQPGGTTASLQEHLSATPPPESTSSVDDQAHIPI